MMFHSGSKVPQTIKRLTDIHSDQMEFVRDHKDYGTPFEIGQVIYRCGLFKIVAVDEASRTLYFVPANGDIDCIRSGVVGRGSIYYGDLSE
jgi:hypothetical protein